MVFFPTNRCNLKCKMCWRHHFEFNPGDEIPDERLLTLVDECADLGVKGWSIAGGGDPMMRASLVLRMCERIRQRDMQGMLITNALLLKTEHLQKFIEIGWTDIQCSLEGPTAAINDPLRGNGTFQRATDVMRQCAQMRHDAGAQFPKLSFYSTLTKDNYSSLVEMVELTQRLGCDNFRAGLATGDWCKELLLEPRHLKALPGIVARAERRARELGIGVDLYPVLKEPSWLEFRDQLMDILLGKRIGISNALCFDPWYSLAVLADGRIGPCCCSWHEDAPKITDAPLRELWFGPYFTKAREEIAANRPLDFCNQCPPILMKRAREVRRYMQMDDQWEHWAELPMPRKAFLSLWKLASWARQKKQAILK